MDTGYNLLSRNKTTHSRGKRSPFPKWTYLLFYVFALYLVIPIIDVPLIGLSLSAPIFFFIAMVCILRPPRPWFKKYSGWILLAVLIWFGIFLSTTANGLLSQGVNIDTDGYKYLIRYMYWILVFIITAYFGNQAQVLNKVIPILGLGILLVALLRWSEVIFGGRLGVGTNTTIMSQNGYGFQFSTFSPFVLVMLLRAKRSMKIFWLISFLIILGATAINGSRGSWVATSIGAVGVTLILFFSKPRKLIGGFIIITFVIATGAGLWKYIPKAAETIETRFNTLQSLEEDRSYIIRRVMIQKGLRMFQDSPLIGVGANRFTLTWADISLPELLAYRSVGEFERKNAHNSYIQFLAEFGLVGSIPMATLLLLLAFRGYFTVRNSTLRNQLIPLAIFISFIQMSVHMWVVTALTGTLTWFIYGLLAAVIINGNRENQKSDDGKFISSSLRIIKGRNAKFDYPE